MQIEAHYAATGRMAPAMLRIPGASRMVPTIPAVAFTGTRFLSTLSLQNTCLEEIPEPAATDASLESAPTPTSQIALTPLSRGPSDGDAEATNATALLGGTHTGASGTGPAVGAELFAAVVSGDAPAKVSANQLIALIERAQYFLAVDLLDPLRIYAEPVIAALGIAQVRPEAQASTCSQTLALQAP